MREDALPFGCLFVLVVAVVAFGWWTFIAIRDNTAACQAKGGTYLVREGVCIDVKRVPLR